MFTLLHKYIHAYIHRCIDIDDLTQEPASPIQCSEKCTSSTEPASPRFSLPGRVRLQVAPSHASTGRKNNALCCAAAIYSTLRVLVLRLQTIMGEEKTEVRARQCRAGGRQFSES